MMSETNAETQEKLDVITRLKQEFSMPISYEEKEYTVYGKYEHDTQMCEKRLNIDIPELVFDSRRSGMHAEFSDHYALGIRGVSVRGREYSHNEELAEVFKIHVKPVLDDKLPPHMKKLMQECMEESGI